MFFTRKQITDRILIQARLFDFLPDVVSQLIEIVEVI